MNLHYAFLRFIDIGAGLGKPNFHVAQDPCCRLSLGVELEDIRWQVRRRRIKLQLPFPCYRFNASVNFSF